MEQVNNNQTLPEWYIIIVFVVLPPRGVALQILKYKSNNFEKTLVAVEHAMFVSDDLNIDTCSDLSTIPSKQLTII